MKELIGIENRKTKDGRDFKIISMREPIDSKVGEGYSVSREMLFDLEKIELQGKLSLGCGIRLFKEGDKGFERVTLIVCTAPGK